MSGPQLVDTKMIHKLSSKTIKRYPTHFDDTYRSIRLPDREVAFFKTTQGSYHIFLCLPYEVDKDEDSGVIGMGANVVIREWIVKGEKEAVKTINKCLTPARMDKIDRGW